MSWDSFFVMAYKPTISTELIGMLPTTYRQPRIPTLSPEILNSNGVIPPLEVAKDIKKRFEPHGINWNYPLQTATQILTAAAPNGSPTSYIGPHSQNTGFGALQLLQPGDGVQNWESFLAGTTLHDIGKIGIGESGIHNQGRLLTPEEYTLMMEHPERARIILEALNAPREVIEIPFTHQEKFDGTGYPLKVSGAKIPLPCQAASLADAIDAMERRYSGRKISPDKKALEILGGAYTQFNPEFVKRWWEQNRDDLSANIGKGFENAVRYAKEL